MSDIVRFSSATTPNPITVYLKSVNTPDYSSLPNTIINPDLSAVINVPIRYWKHVAGAILEMTAGEKTQVDTDIAVALLTQNRVGGKSFVDDTSAQGIIIRAIADIVKDEINILRQWITSFKVEVAAASSLADLKTRIASLPAMPDRTLVQFRNAVKGTIDVGNVDA